MSPRREHETAKQILRYFVRNPEAADGLEGMVRWRLLEEMIHRSVEETHAALMWLVSRGFLTETRVPGSEKVFCLNREKQAEADHLLAAAEPDES